MNNNSEVPEGAGVKDCCKKVENLRPEVDDKGRKFNRCQECTCRHFTMEAEMGEYKNLLSGLN